MENCETNSKEQLTELQAITSTLDQSLRRRVIFWGIRWAIGFGLIALAVRQWPSASWLWWVGFTVAALSLVGMLVGHRILQRKADGVRRQLEQLDHAASEAGGESHGDQ